MSTTSPSVTSTDPPPGIFTPLPYWQSQCLRSFRWWREIFNYFYVATATSVPPVSCWLMRLYRWLASYLAHLGGSASRNDQGYLFVIRKIEQTHKKGNQVPVGDRLPLHSILYFVAGTQDFTRDCTQVFIPVFVPLLFPLTSPATWVASRHLRCIFLPLYSRDGQKTSFC